MTIPQTTPPIAKRIEGHCKFLGIPVFSGRFVRVIKMTRFWLENGEEGLLHVIFTPTTEQVVMAQHDTSFCSTLMQSTLNVPDTVGLEWGMRRLWSPKQHTGEQKLEFERIPGIDLAEALVKEAISSPKRVLFVGGRPGTAALAAQRFGELVAGIDGAKDIRHETDAERHVVLQAIKVLRPVLVLVAYGAPWQEEWVITNAAALQEAGVSVAMVVGGSLDVWARKLPRAPLQWRQNGFEWLWRLLHEPKRWKRQLRLVEFVGLVGREWIRQRFTRSGIS